jgi:lysophospholipase L1-like esterase
MLRLIFLFVVLNYQLSGQAYIEEINAFKKLDSMHFPEKSSILFIGSSSITNWKNTGDYFPGYPILNRGFGGSTLVDVSHYVNDIVLPYNPKQVVIYCGENDAAGDSMVDSNSLVKRFIHLFSKIRKALPNAKISYISMKPSPSRAHLMPLFIKSNNMISTFLAHEPNTSYIDVFHAMLQEDGRPIETLFLEDRLHMNPKGYAIWKDLILPHLVK